MSKVKTEEIKTILLLTVLCRYLYNMSDKSSADEK